MSSIWVWQTQTHLHLVPASRAAIPVIDPETCIDFKTGRCKKTCIEACGDRHAVDLKQQPTHETIKVGPSFWPRAINPLMPARFRIMAMVCIPMCTRRREVERLINASGPTGGEVILRDGRKPQAIGIIHCVGSRDRKH